MQRMPIVALNALPLYILEKFNVYLSPKATVLLIRLPTVIISIILGISIFVWTKKIYGIKSGIFSLVLYTFCPNILAHSRLITNDIYCTFFMFVSTYFFIRYLNLMSLKNLIIAAALTGITQITKHTALLLLPIFLILFLCRKYVFTKIVAYKNDLRFDIKTRHVLIHAILFILIVILVINMGYVFKYTLIPMEEYSFKSQLLSKMASYFPGFPVPLPKIYVETFDIGLYLNSTGEGHGLIYLFGELSKFGWWYYFIVALVLKLPLGFLFMVVIALLITGKYIKKISLDEFSLIFIVLAVLIYFSFFCTAQIGIRYILPIFPFLYVFVGKIISHKPIVLRPLFYKIMISLFLFWYLVSSLSYHPHYLSYFNELIGSRKNMYKYLADSNVDWGQSKHYLREYLRNNRYSNIRVNPDNPTSGTIIVSINVLVGIAEPEKYRWLRENFEPVDHIAYSWLIFNVP